MKIDGVPGIALSDIGGIPLCDVDLAELSVKQLRKFVEVPIRHLVASGVQPTDLKLDNLHFVKAHPNPIMMFDFGDVDSRRSADVDAVCKELVDEVVRRYKRTTKGKKMLAAL